MAFDYKKMLYYSLYGFKTSAIVPTDPVHTGQFSRPAFDHRTFRPIPRIEPNGGTHQ